MARVAQDRRGGPSAPALLYSALTAALVVLVASLAFTARQPPPPQIAELTPQARHQITKAPEQLGSSVGSASGGSCTGSGPCGPGGGGGGGGSGTTTLPAQPPGVTPSTVNLAAVHHCYGNPPRQLEDTQSPPCVAYWAGNNGGATSSGVSGNQITVTVDPVASGLPGDPAGSRVAQDLQNFFNRYFEFYGRQLLLKPVNENGGVDCSTAQAEADGISQTYHPFASTSINNTGEVCTYTELAHDHVVVGTFTRNLSQATAQSFAPYLWEYPMSEGMTLANTGAFVCAQLAGHDAVYSPDATIASRPRRFGVILEYMQTPYAYSTAPLTQQLDRCGVTVAKTETFEGNGTSINQQAPSAGSFSQQAVLAMKTAGVTTVLCFCTTDNAIEAGIAPAANSQDYHPEWLLASWSNGADGTVRAEWSSEQQGLIGMTAKPAQVHYANSILAWALQAVDPGYSPPDNMGGYQEFYWELLLIASGIQMAGPDLTPYSFQRGLMAARFPNPFSPEQEGVASFLGGSHSMTADMAVMWWSASTLGPDGNAGAWCYADGARRFNLASWASTKLVLFAGACDATPPGT